MEVGIRDLKAKLSEYVGRAAAGEEITITDRGTPVAVLASLGSARSMSKGIEEGWIEPPKSGVLGDFARVKSARSVLDVLDEDRM
jgi:prevent-host-death family protein